jgi:hypothetical protein
LWVPTGTPSGNQSALSASDAVEDRSMFVWFSIAFPDRDYEKQMDL